MPTIRNARRAAHILFALTIAVTASSRAFADSYSVTHATGAPATISAFIAGDDYGNFTFATNSPLCGFQVFGCNITHYVNGSPDIVTALGSPTPPLWSDPLSPAGTDSCTVTPGLGFIQFAAESLCNNGHLIFSGEYTAPGGSSEFGIWAGSDPDPVTSLLALGEIGTGIMSSNGNAYFLNVISFDPNCPAGPSGCAEIAIDLDTRPTPEPASIALLGTGLAGLVGIMRRRFYPAS
jgi:hypothetical protein